MKVFIKKKTEYQLQEVNDIKILDHYYHVKNLTKIEIFQVYTLTNSSLKKGNWVYKILADKVVDEVIYQAPKKQADFQLAIALLPGQFNQKVESARQCWQMLFPEIPCSITQSTLYRFWGKLADKDKIAIQKYYLNPVDSYLLNDPKIITENLNSSFEGKDFMMTDFENMNKIKAVALIEKFNLCLSPDDILFIKEKFKLLKRLPSFYEIKILDTYWSDHCRHSTFNTHITKFIFPRNKFGSWFSNILQEIEKDLLRVNKTEFSLMNLAILAASKLRKKGQLPMVEISQENNACSVFVDIPFKDGQDRWLLQFKNETHNHPTEIEPIGGAATCIGGAIRDPLSGRAYVFQAVRLSGSADPLTKSSVFPEKLNSHFIAKQAAKGFSSYGNQIGLATTLVKEYYHPNYRAKRFELGAVMGAVPYKNIIRQNPAPNDLILLIGGRTGRDGIGGATGSSRVENNFNLENSIAEVQKGNAIEERKLQRFFRNPEVCKKIKKCNDFGAGGIVVAVGELAAGIRIDLTQVKLKTAHLNPLEILLSESQERLAIVINPKNLKWIIRQAQKENIEASVIAKVIAKPSFEVYYYNKRIVNLPREILSSNGFKQQVEIDLRKNLIWDNVFETIKIRSLSTLLIQPNIRSQKGLIEQFDSTIGSTTVLMPLGGKFQNTHTQASVQKLPNLTNQYHPICSLISFGFNPYLCSKNPFLGGVYANVEALSKLVACGLDYKQVYFSYQEYFPKLNKDKRKWAAPLYCLTGANHFLEKMNLAAIGGKDSMSGTYKDMDVPPSFVAFGFGTSNINTIIGNEFIKSNSYIYLFSFTKDRWQLPNWEELQENFQVIHTLIKKRTILSARTLEIGGLAEAIFQMVIGNKIGCKIKTQLPLTDSFYGYIIVETSNPINKKNSELLGETNSLPYIQINNKRFSIERHLELWQNQGNKVFNSSFKSDNIILKPNPVANKITRFSTLVIPAIMSKKISVCLPVFTGTNCEFDTENQFKKNGGEVYQYVFQNTSPNKLQNSLNGLAKQINKSQIFCLPGGFSLADEPEGAGKYLALVLNHPIIRESLKKLWQNGGLILGICNGFQALIKSGLLPFADFENVLPKNITLYHNNSHKHFSGIVQTRIVSNLSPWLSPFKINEIHSLPISHGEGKLILPQKMLNQLFNNNQIATQYVNDNGQVTMEYPYNPNGSINAIEGLLSPDGRILGKMGHGERIDHHLYKNIPNFTAQNIFSNAINYFKKN